MNSDWSLEQIAKEMKKANELKRIELLIAVVNGPRFGGATDSEAYKAIEEFVKAGPGDQWS